MVRYIGEEDGMENNSIVAFALMIYFAVVSTRPMKKTCQFCSVEVVTYVEHEVNQFFPLICLGTFVIFGLLAFVIAPVVFFLTKNAVHRCSRCLQKMGEKGCFGLPDDFS